MQTTADQKLDSATEKLLSAWRDLQAVLDPDTHGHEDFSKERMQQIHSVSDTLYKLYKSLDDAETMP